jgi:hypothetical protein
MPAKFYAPLSYLTSLEVLELGFGWPLGIGALLDLQVIISNMLGLRELEISFLTLFDQSIYMRGLDFLVDSLPQITRLHFKNVLCVLGAKDDPAAFRQDGIAGLRDISLHLPDPNVATRVFSRLQTRLLTWQPWTRLERLKLVFQSSHGLPEITHWNAMPSVTELTLKASQLRMQPATSSASFLSNFPQLQHLVLHDILDARRLGVDIPQMAALTKLTRLEMLPCICFEEVPREPQWIQKEWSGMLRPFKNLTTLVKLEEVVLFVPHLSKAARGREKLGKHKVPSARDEMGLPRMRFVVLDPHMHPNMST